MVSFHDELQVNSVKWCCALAVNKLAQSLYSFARIGHTELLCKGKSGQAYYVTFLKWYHYCSVKTVYALLPWGYVGVHEDVLRQIILLLSN